MMDISKLLVLALGVTFALQMVGAAMAASEVGETTILKWKDGKKAAFLLAFDDSCPSHLANAIPELRKRNLVGTFYVIAGNGNFKDHPEWAQQAKTGSVVLGNHTFTHGDVATAEQLDQELTKATDAINKAVPDLKPGRLISFGQPGGVKWTITRQQLDTALAQHNLINRPPFWGAVLHVKTVDDMRKLVDDTIQKGEMGHLDFHGVGGDWLVTPMDYYIAVLDKLDAERSKLWVTDHISWHKYQAERSTAKVKVLASDAKQIRIELTGNMDPQLYDQPLTLETKVPATWAKCVITQGATRTEAAPAAGIIRYAATPGAGEIVVANAE